MTLAVVGYPRLSRKDYDWIQSLRTQHDELYYPWVEPHFTFVFPTTTVGKETLVDHVTAIVKWQSSIPITIRTARLGDDAFSDYNHVFFIPDEGHSRIVELHDRLYSGVLGSALRKDIPYMPHLGVGNSKDRQACERLVEELNANPLNICGGIYELEVVSIEGQVIIREAVLPLQ